MSEPPQATPVTPDALDVEKADEAADRLKDKPPSNLPRKRRWVEGLRRYGVETEGIAPIPFEVKKQSRQNYLDLFAFWVTLSWTILPFSVGSSGPLVYSLSLRDSCLVILFINILCNIPPACMSMWGVRLGLRSIVFTKFSFGTYGVIVVVIFNVASMLGFSIANCVLGGQTLSSVTDGRMTYSVGIIIIALLAFIISFFGSKVLQWYERVAFIPVIVGILVALGRSAQQLSLQAPAEPASAPAVLSFAAVIAGFVLTWSSVCSDYTTYMRSDASGLWVFAAVYSALVICNVLVQSFGAAVGACVPAIAEWQAGYTNGSAGGLLRAVLGRTGFGDFLTVLLALSTLGNVAATMYSVSLNLQVILPIFAHVPRYAMSLVATAIVVPIACAGAYSYYDNLSAFLGLIGYWSSAYIACLSAEHLWIRKRKWSNYTIESWNTSSQLPPGIAAVTALVCGFAASIPAMNSVWWIGPLADHSGDLGFEMAFVVALVLYLPLRLTEIRLSGR